MGNILKMSQKELDRLEIIQKVIENRITQKTGAKVLNLSYRQIKRLVSLYRRFGIKGLISKKREKLANRKFSDKFKLEVKKNNGRKLF